MTRYHKDQYQWVKWILKFETGEIVFFVNFIVKCSNRRISWFFYAETNRTYNNGSFLYIRFNYIIWAANIKQYYLPKSNDKEKGNEKNIVFIYMCWQCRGHE